MNEGADKIGNSAGLDRGVTRAGREAHNGTRHVVIALAAYQPDVPFLVEQLASIVAQDYTDWSCVITLDSPIADLRSRAELATYFDDERFRWLENPNRLGHKGNFERAISIAASNGAWAIATCDQDDVWYPSKLRVLSDALGRLTKPSLVHSDMHLLHEGAILDATLWQQSHKAIHNVGCWQLLVMNKVTGCTMMLHADVARAHPTIPDAFTYHDHWFAVMASISGSVVAVHDVLGAYRQHGANVLGAERFEWGVRPTVVTRPRHELADGERRWLMLKQRAQAAVASGVTLPTHDRRMILSRYDMGARLMIAGLWLALSDPRLSRYCIRIAIGKFLDTFRAHN